jgi:uncharacterized protein (TIGR03085 family)
VTSVNVARAERAALCDLFLEVGPDQPTLCTGWTTRDLAAHLLVRERRPDAAAGIMLSPLRGRMERVRRAAAARPYEETVAKVRNPPPWSLAAIGPLDRATNTVEFFVHHEDVRRAQPDWAPRELDAVTTRALWHSVAGVARLALRRFPARVEIEAPGSGTTHAGAVDAGASGPVVRLTGDPGELAVFLTGRQQAARVELSGLEDLTQRLRRARLGL